MNKAINLIVFLFFNLIFVNSVSFAQEVKIDLYINDINVRPDSKPYISETNRTMVPISFVANEFKFGVVWNAKNREVVITKDGKEVKLYIDSKYAYVDGVKVEIGPGKSTSVVIKNGRTMVPVAFVAKTFDVEVGWVAYPRWGGIVKFYSKDYVKPTTPVDVTTPTGKLSDAQSKYVVDKMNASVSSGTGFEANVAKLTDKQREIYVESFIRDFKPPTGIQWLVSKETMHYPGMSCIAGLEIKTENGVKYQRVFNTKVNFNDGNKLYSSSDFEYRSNWEKIN